MEYALVLLAFLSMVVALGTLWHVACEGAFVERAREAGSHNADGGVTTGLLEDVFSY